MAREERGMSRAELAAAASVRVDAVRCWEAAKRLPRKDTLALLAAALETTPAALAPFGFAGREQASHVIFQVADDYGPTPSRSGDVAALVAEGEDVRRFLADWARARAAGDDAWRARARLSGRTVRDAVCAA